MPKMLIDVEEAKQVLLDYYKKKNPDVTEIVIEGMITIDEANKLLKQKHDHDSSVVLSAISTEKVPTPEIVNASSDAFDRPGDLIDKISPPAAGPTDPDMIALVQSLQTVIDDSRVLNITYHKGANKGYKFELTKGLEERCTWCGYVAMSDKDLDEHKKTYHKDIVSREKAVDQAHLEKAKADKRERIAEHAAGTGWGKKNK